MDVNGRKLLLTFLEDKESNVESVMSIIWILNLKRGNGLMMKKQFLLHFTNITEIGGLTLPSNYQEGQIMI